MRVNAGFLDLQKRKLAGVEGADRRPLGAAQMEHCSTNVQEGRTGIESSPFSRSKGNLGFIHYASAV
jgi:hypothetical protein